jgi:hypothetical protein
MLRGGDDAGRFSDTTQWGDYSNTVTQSLGIIMLARAGEAIPAQAVEFLAGQACADGGFQSQFNPTTCKSEPDSTAFALTALAAAAGSGSGTAIDAAAVEARDWLLDNRRSDGSWNAEGAVNATGLAASALLLVGEDVSASVGWLEDAQMPDGGLPINPGQGSSDVRATTQATLALAGESMLSVGEGGTDRVSLVPGQAAPAQPGPQKEPTPAPQDETLTSATDEDQSAPAVPYDDVAMDDVTQLAAVGSLPRTGLDLLPLSLLAVVLVVSGAAALVVARNRKGGEQA